jgi:hypothetical protein
MAQWCAMIALPGSLANAANSSGVRLPSLDVGVRDYMRSAAVRSCAAPRVRDKASVGIRHNSNPLLMKKVDQRAMVITSRFNANYIAAAMTPQMLRQTLVIG